MSDESKIALPIWAIVLDGIGTVFLAAGLLGLFGGESLLASLPVNLREIAIALIVLGALLMAPLIIVLLQSLVSRR